MKAVPCSLAAGLVFAPVLTGRINSPASASGPPQSPVSHQVPGARGAASVAGQACVLVVDDNDLVRVGAVRSLGRLGYGSLTASDAEDALSLLRSGAQQIDLLFTDIRMPGAMDGLELARVVQREFPRIAVLLTTGFAGWRSREMQSPILYKPYRLAELSAAIAACLQAHPHST